MRKILGTLVLLLAAYLLVSGMNGDPISVDRVVEIFAQILHALVAIGRQIGAGIATSVGG